ncbi:MAG: permease-like cell division protein FtsX [Clostridia bacterium]|nr:permease-like cell division protein FtsX [Clostridia bacterium]
MSRIKYFMGEAKKNILRNGLMSVASLFTIVSCLVILGVFMIISLNVETVTEQIKDQCEIQVFLDMNTSDERVAAIGNEISSIENIKSVEIYTKEQMLEEVKATMFKGREDLIESFSADDNPFSDSYKIVLNDISLASETAELLSAIENVESVTNKQDVVNVVLSISKNVRAVTVVIMLLLLLVAVVIISNTVRLTVFNRRKEIGIMKYIGATDRFIRVPFIFEGVIVGIMGALVSFILMFGAYVFILRLIETSNFDLFTLIGPEPVALWLGVIFLFVGGLIGMLGSVVSMKKYLKV